VHGARGAALRSGDRGLEGPRPKGRKGEGEGGAKDDDLEEKGGPMDARGCEAPRIWVDRHRRGAPGATAAITPEVGVPRGRHIQGGVTGQNGNGSGAGNWGEPPEEDEK